MDKIPVSVLETEQSQRLCQHFELERQGKVRDLYAVNNGLLVVTTDRASSHDFVLPVLVPNKGYVLNGVNVFMRKYALEGAPSDIIAFGAGIDRYLPAELRGDTDLQRRATYIRRCQPVKYEFIVRGFITGSMWRAYNAAGGRENGYEFCGHKLPPGLHDGSRIDDPIFTPSTKAESGHDVNVDHRVVYKEWPALANRALAWYNRLFKFLEVRGLYLADTKFEMSGGGTLLDEVCTPDSSRFWPVDAWKQANAKGCAPSGLDKEPTRAWASSLEFSIGGETYKGLGNLDTEDEEHLAAVHSMTVPDEVVSAMSQRYITSFGAMARQTLEEFWLNDLGVAV